MCVSLLCLCECLFAKAYLDRVHFAMNLFSTTVSRLPETILKDLLTDIDSDTSTQVLQSNTSAIFSTNQNEY